MFWSDELDGGGSDKRPSPGTSLKKYLEDLPERLLKSIPVTEKHYVDAFLKKANDLDRLLHWSRESNLYVEWDRLVAEITRWCAESQAQKPLSVAKLRRMVEIADATGWKPK